MSWDILFHGVEVVVLVFGVALPIWKGSNRMKNVLQDYPPHRHESNGVIRYPPGMSPGRTETLGIGFAQDKPQP